MIKPHPITYTCPACNWSKTIAPQSDALTPSENITQCPKCGNQQLTIERAGIFATTKAEVSNMLSSIFGKK
jgi:RNA polymerase subunit RPABC4/transcription elongation factor Spt4